MKYCFIFIKFFLFNIFNLFIIPINSNLSFKYPTAITLSDGNILVAEKNGIYICIHTFSYILSTEYNFNNEDQIKEEESLSKVILKRKNTLIFGLINFKLFMFNANGTFLYKSSTKLIDDSNINYCDLIPISSSNNYFYYIIGYFNSNNYLNLLYYKYDKLNNNNHYITLKTDQTFKMKDSSNSFRYKNKGISCEYMDEYINKKYTILVCFYIITSNNNDYLVQGYYLLSSDTIYNSYDTSCDYYQVGNTNIIKSEITNNYKKALVCLISTDNDTKCLKFYIKNYKGEFYEIIPFEKKCRAELYGINVRFLYETKRNCI